jgi:hypothetical protein
MHTAPPESGPFNDTKDVLNATVIRDTVTVNANSSLVVRCVANNPGALQRLPPYAAKPGVLLGAGCATAVVQ